MYCIGWYYDDKPTQKTVVRCIVEENQEENKYREMGEKYRDDSISLSSANNIFRKQHNTIMAVNSWKKIYEYHKYVTPLHRLIPTIESVGRTVR
mmetsp:Transcript_11697/g.24760  ORF Transcript_11697/g.24760 Transcript_11697/m.24760 type:complete len:94 (+) Transcript_11697:2562-2843(+)